MTKSDHLNLVNKCMWLVEVCLREPGSLATARVKVTTGDIVRTTGVDRRVIEDCIYEHVQQGNIRILPDSSLVWARS